MVARVLAGVAAAGLLGLAGCRRPEPERLDPVRAIRSRVEPRFRAPQDGRLTPAQIDLYLKVRRAAGRGSDAEAARALLADPAEFAWTRSRITEGLAAVDARRVAEAAGESYARGLAALREARRAAPDARTAARLDSEIAAIERERASLRRPPADIPPAAAANGALVEARRAEIDSVRQ